MQQRSPTLEVFLLGQIAYRDSLLLQEQLIREACSRADGQITLLLCEHPPIITIGSSGSRADVDLRQVVLAGRQVEIFRVPRGGGTLLQLPGQLAVYPIVPLDWHDWTVGELLYRLQAGIAMAMEEVGAPGFSRPDRYGLWGDSGQLVTMGLAVRDWVTHFGAHVQVNPPPPLMRYIVTDPIGGSSLGSLCQERQRTVTMTAFRSRLVRTLARSLGDLSWHVYTGHPLLATLPKPDPLFAWTA